MEDFILPTVEKKIEEARQGEAFNAIIAPNANPDKFFYIESYGCAMNFSDSEIVASILSKEGYGVTTDYLKADLILINTCSIREKAEQTVRHRLMHFNGVKKHKKDALVGVLGCMAERLKEKLLEEEKIVDLVIGPDAYRSLPELIAGAKDGHKGINVLLSREETYADISPIRLDENGISAFVSIMRGCDNMCSFCVVPFTRGRERSRDPESILQETIDLHQKGYKEITLLGQNVDSYKWKGEAKEKEAPVLVNFAQLLEKVALANPSLRIRFSTSHPKDITDEVIHTIAKHDNICNYIHLPVQSGSSSVLERMNRTYDREWYLERVNTIRRIIPDCGISSDIIAGFCGETEEQHQETLSLMDIVQFDLNYMYYYSERPGTLAARKYEDDIPLETKKRRLEEIIIAQRKHSLLSNQADLGKTFEVLIEKTSKKSESDLCGRTGHNKMVIFPKGSHSIGEYVQVYIEECNGAILKGRVVNPHQ